MGNFKTLLNSGTLSLYNEETDSFVSFDIKRNDRVVNILTGEGDSYIINPYPINDLKHLLEDVLEEITRY